MEGLPLKPCPCCGGTNLKVAAEGELRSIICRSCRLQLPLMINPESRWNTRFEKASQIAGRKLLKIRPMAVQLSAMSFKECPQCEQKLEQELCPACLHNRHIITEAAKLFAKLV